MSSLPRKLKPDVSGTPRQFRLSDTADRPELAVKMDYSNIYKENEELEEDLEDHLADLHKNKYRTWVEKRQQLKVIRQQVEVIMRLRAAVNSKQPGESINFVASSRPRQASQFISYKKTSTEQKKEEADNVLDVKEMAQTTKTQMRINQEREKFSSKNLFNVRRKNRGLGASVLDTGISTEGKLFTKRASFGVQRHAEINGANHNEDNSNSYTTETSMKAMISKRPTTACGEPKSYMQPTLSSRKGSRPRTAIGTVGGTDQNVEFEASSPSRIPSAGRCRSRRELELLSRLQLKQEETTPKDEDGAPVWEVIKESRRKKHLQQLRSQGKELELKVEKFLNDLQSFNSKHKKTNNRQVSDIFYD